MRLILNHFLPISARILHSIILINLVTLNPKFADYSAEYCRPNMATIATKFEAVFVELRATIGTKLRQSLVVISALRLRAGPRGSREVLRRHFWKLDGGDTLRFQRIRLLFSCL